jgi:hypothetical protein
MIACVYFVTALLVLTKLGDVATTLHRIEHADRETNPFARHMMIRIGTEKAVWIVLLLALVIIGVCAVAALNGGLVMQSLFIVAGAAISVVQAAVAHCNWTGKDNLITRQIRNMHQALQRIMQR